MLKKIKSFFYALAFNTLAFPFVSAAAPSYDSTNKYGLPGGTITGIITGILSFLLMAVGIIGVMGFAIAGILYLTAAGDDDRIKKAKSAMTYSIIGVIVALAGYVALQFAQNLLDAEGASTDL